MCIYLHEYSIIFFLFVHYYIPLIVHLYFTLYTNNNIYADCERCGVIKNIKSLCDFIVRSAPTRITSKKGYELYNKCTEEIEKLSKYLKLDDK